MGELSMSASNTTTIRLDLSKQDGWTTFGELKTFIAECERFGATDNTPAIVANMGQALLGGTIFKPIIGVTIDHAAAQSAIRSGESTDDTAS